MRRNKYKWMVLAPIGFAAFLTLMGLATMTLWNWLVPALFNGTVITFWQAIGVLALAKLLTGFAGWGRWGHRGWYGHGHHGYWRKRWDEKMATMTPEEREKFKRYYYDRCGYRGGWMKDREKTDEKNEAGYTGA